MEGECVFDKKRNQWEYYPKKISCLPDEINIKNLCIYTILKKLEVNQKDYITKLI